MTPDKLAPDKMATTDKLATDKMRPTTRLASVPGAFGAVLLIGAVAFGATTLRDGATQAATTAGASPNADAAPDVATTLATTPATDRAPDPNAPEPKPAWTPDRPKATPTAMPIPTEQPKPKPEPTPNTATSKPVSTKQPAPTQKPKPPTTTLALEGWAKETKVKLAWTPYVGDGFEYYKVVRSGDASVTWPPTGDDELIAAISDRSAPYAADKPPCATPWRYAAFAVRHGTNGYVTLAPSNVVTVTVACAPEPTPVEVKAIGFELVVKPGEGINLAWDQCTADGFAAYKVVRSTVNPDPRFPLNDGTELVAVIGDPGQTAFVDTAVSAGETWTYRVVAVTATDHGYVPICQTAAASATAQ